MARGFNFDEFDLQMAKALGVVAPDTPLEGYQALRIVPENNELSQQEIERSKALRGIQDLASIAIPHGLKPAS